MSRNLCSSTCPDCGKYTFRLSDMRDKPIEFRAYFDNPPVIGCKCPCPVCGTLYFLWWNEAKWHNPPFGNGYYGDFAIDLSYYESFNDEHSYDNERMCAELGVQYKDIGWWQMVELWNAKFPNRPLLIHGGEPACLEKGNREHQQMILGWRHNENT